MHRHLLTIAAVGIVLLASSRPGDAALITFVGEDIQPNTGAAVRTNSDAAAAAFRTSALAIAPVGTISFESAPLGAFSNLTVATGVAINGTDFSGNAQTIRNTTNFPASPTLDGFNTTAGGSRFVEMIGGTLTFTFTTPTQTFGAYLTGVQTNFFTDTVSFSDGTSQAITLKGAGTTSSIGEIAYIGFTDAGKSITSITITAQGGGFYDAIGVDDVSFQAAVPEPASLALVGIAGVVGLVLARVRRCRVAG